MVGESTYGLPPDSTGKGVRILDVTVLLPTGVAVTSEMQVVTIADKDGNLLTLDPRKIEETNDLMLREMRTQTLLLMMINDGINHRRLTRQDLNDMLDENDSDQENE